MYIYVYIHMHIYIHTYSYADRCRKCWSSLGFGRILRQSVVGGQKRLHESSLPTHDVKSEEFISITRKMDLICVTFTIKQCHYCI